MYFTHLKIGLLITVLVIPWALNTITPASAQFGANCNPSMTVKKTGTSGAGSSEIIIKPADADKISIDVKFTSGTFGNSSQSSCPGAAAIVYNWNNTRDPLTINVNKVYAVTVPATQGIYVLELKLSDPPDFIPRNVYLTRQVTVKVANDILNPPVSNTNNPNTNTVNGNVGGSPNTSTPNAQINTGTTVSYDIDYDATLGTFFNPLQANSLPEIITRLIRILFTLTGLAAVIVIIIAGFRMVVDSGNETQLKKAKEAITWAIMGLIVSLLAFSIVAIIQRIIQS